MKTSKPADLRAEYDFGAGTRGQYAARYAEGSNVVVLAPDVAAHFPTSAAVNRQLRTLLPRRKATPRRLLGA